MLQTLILLQIACGTVIASTAIVPLRAISAIVGSRPLRRAWNSLTILTAGCTLLLIAYGFFRFWKPGDYGDLIACTIVLLGTVFVFAVAWLSKRTAIDMLRMSSLEAAAFSDALTGLANRRRFDQRLAAETERAGQPGGGLSLILIDVDRFKTINDTHGHLGGDLALRTIAATMSANLPPSNTAFRLGGDEFAVLVPTGDPTLASAIAESIRLDVDRSEIVLHAASVRCTVSLGVATLRQGETPEIFVKRADIALYAAKQGGRNRVSLTGRPISGRAAHEGGLLRDPTTDLDAATRLRGSAAA